MSANQIKLIYPIRSATKYALLKNASWISRSIEWSASHRTPKLQIFFDQTPMSLQWIFPSPSSLDAIRKLSLSFEQDLFDLLQNYDLMPETPHIQVFHIESSPHFS